MTQPPRETGRRGGLSVSAHIQNANQIVNVIAGPIPELLGACFINDTWEHDNSFWRMLSQNYLYVSTENTVYPGTTTYEYYLWN